MNPMTGQAEFNGTSIVDVTDPANPKYLKHIPGAEGLGEAGGAQMVRTCAGKDLPKGDPAKFYLLRVFGGQGHEIWDVTDPANPSLLTRIVMGLRDTHKSWWECDTGIAYLVSGAPGWRVKRMAQIYDLSDPAKPVHIRDFGLPGQEPGATGTIPADMHGPISTGPKGNRVYFGYGTDKGGVHADRRPREASQRSEGADAGEPALSGDQQARSCRPGTAPTPPSRCCRCRSPSSPRTRTGRPATSS